MRIQGGSLTGLGRRCRGDGKESDRSMLKA